jgi:hypothetical protein
MRQTVRQMVDDLEKVPPKEAFSMFSFSSSFF